MQGFIATTARSRVGMVKQKQREPVIRVMSTMLGD